MTPKQIDQLLLVRAALKECACQLESTFGHQHPISEIALKILADICAIDRALQQQVPYYRILLP